MRKFILIDPWLSDVGGHNFQYALDVASSANERGYEAVLAVHKSLPESCRFPGSWDIRRLFHFGVCTKHWLGPDGRNPSPCDLDGNWLANTDLKQVGNRSARARLRKVLAHWADWPARNDRRRRVRDFASGCSQLFNGVDPGTGDLIFLPSMSEFDFLGLARFLRDDPRSLNFTWHLQFHFNIFVGRDGEFAGQQEELRRFQRQFQSALSEIPEHRFKFHATTQAMARQYEYLGLGPFQNLPYPVQEIDRENSPLLSSGPTSSHSASKPLRVTCAGVVRREKGKKKFGPLIASLWPDCLASGRMQFVFQASPRHMKRWLPRHLRSAIAVVPDGEPVAAPLRSAPYPLGAQAYMDLIRKTDLGLFLYDSRRYFARASGILCEMLAAGIPAIVPAGCWLADQISAEMYRHVALLCADQALVADSRPLELVVQDLRARAVYQFPRGISDVAIQFAWPAGIPAGTYIQVEAECRGKQGPQPGAIQRMIVGSSDNLVSHQQSKGDVDGPPTVRRTNSFVAEQIGVVMPIPRNTQVVQLSVQFAHTAEQVPIAGVQVTALTPPRGTEHHPRSRVGLIASAEDEVPELVREAIQHYEHYRSTAEAYKATWLNAHHPDRTIRLLEESDSAQHGTSHTQYNVAESKNCVSHISCAVPRPPSVTAVH